MKEESPISARIKLDIQKAEEPKGKGGENKPKARRNRLRDMLHRWTGKRKSPELKAKSTFDGSPPVINGLESEFWKKLDAASAKSDEALNEDSKTSTETARTETTEAQQDGVKTTASNTLATSVSESGKETEMTDWVREFESALDKIRKQETRETGTIENKQDEKPSLSIQKDSEDIHPSQDEVYNNLNLKDIDLGKLKIDKNFSTETGQIYTFANENLFLFFRNRDLTNKRVACVGGSGDFIINAFMRGAKSVDGVEITAAGCFFGELKLAGLSQFDFKEFKDFFAKTGHTNFFGRESKKPFSYEKYVKLRPHISERARGFFDGLILQGGNSKLLRLYPDGIINDKVRSETLTSFIPYLQSEGDYSKAKEALKGKQVIFYPQDMGKFLDDKKGSNYDVVYLSNILDYIPGKDAEKRDKDKARDIMMKKSGGALAEDGEVLYYEFLPTSGTRVIEPELVRIEGMEKSTELFNPTRTNRLVGYKNR